jgi:hypothetical protein
MKTADNSVANPHYFDADPDPAFRFDADPACHLEAVPDPSKKRLKTLEKCSNRFPHSF